MKEEEEKQEQGEVCRTAVLLRVLTFQLNYL